MTLAGAVILLAIAIPLHLKGRVPRFVCWLLLFVGLGAAAFATKILGGFTQISIAGVGVFAVVALVSGIYFWEEAVKKNGLHRVRSPLIAAVFGIALMNVGGSIGANIQNAFETTGTNINQAVVQSVNSK